MLSYLCHILIPLTILALICLGIRFYGFLRCATPLESWFLGLLAIILWFCFLHFLSFFSRTIWRRTKSFVLKSALISLFIATAWNALGVFWLIKGLTLENDCLGKLGSVILINLQFSFFWIFGIGIVICCAKIQRLRKKSSPYNYLRQNLLKFYTKDVLFTQEEVVAYLTKNHSLLSKMKILDVEKKLIREYFTLKATERIDGQDCAVCLGAIEVGELKSAIGCPHQFHYGCLIEWFEVRPRCPLCKLAFRPKLIAKHFKIEQREN